MSETTMNEPINWTDLPKPIGVFSERNTVMVDLRTGSVVQYYSANTKLNFVQETYFKDKHFLRTESAKMNNLDWGFFASTFDISTSQFAPSVPTPKKISYEHTLRKEKQTPPPKEEPVKDGARPLQESVWKKIAYKIKHIRKDK